MMDALSIGLSVGIVVGAVLVASILTLMVRRRLLEVEQVALRLENVEKMRQQEPAEIRCPPRKGETRKRGA